MFPTGLLLLACSAVALPPADEARRAADPRARPDKRVAALHALAEADGGECSRLLPALAPTLGDPRFGWAVLRFLRTAHGGRLWADVPAALAQDAGPAAGDRQLARTLWPLFPADVDLTDALVRVSRCDDPGVRRWAVHALEAAALSEETRERCLGRLGMMASRDPDPAARAAARVALIRTGSPATLPADQVPRLARLLLDTDLHPTDRAWAAGQLGRAGDHPRAEAALLAALRTPDRGVALAAVEALGTGSHRRRVAEVLAKFADDLPGDAADLRHATELARGCVERAAEWREQARDETRRDQERTRRLEASIADHRRRLRESIRDRRELIWGPADFTVRASGHLHLRRP